VAEAATSRSWTTGIISVRTNNLDSHIWFVLNLGIKRISSYFLKEDCSSVNDTSLTR
jgi:hypothetical protein